jgi:VanZ family protein
VLKKLTLLAAIFYAIALATVSLMTLRNLPEVKLSFADKIFHFLAYSLFTILWYLAFSFSLNLKEKKAILNAVILAVSFGMILEVLQGTITTTRAFDVYDAFANTLGAVIASLIIWLKHKLSVKKN